MKPFDAIARRRAALLPEIAAGRELMSITLKSLRKDFALAGLGLTAGQLLGRKGWLRVAGAAVLALALGRSIAARFFGAR